MNDFPNRPDTPDFWRLAAVVQDFDAAADDGAGLERLVSPIIDMESLVYVADQRALRAQSMGNPLMARTPETDRVKLMATWIDAFAAGALYQQRREMTTEREPDDDCGHNSWRLTETGYARTWSIEMNEAEKVITAYYHGSEDWSDGGAGDDHLECSICLRTKPIPDGWEVDYK